MSTTTESPSAKVRSRLDHPVIDGDGHIMEISPVLLECIKQAGGSAVGERYAKEVGVGSMYERQLEMTLAERRDVWHTYKNWWGRATENVLDRATVMLPRLLNERMEELGLDFVTLYPSEGFFPARLDDEEMRRAGCRGVNLYLAETYRGYADRMTPAAVIPMHTPREAIEELEYAVKVLGLKTVVLQSFVRRPIPRIQREHPEIAHLADRLDFFGLDSDYDYDSVWAKCVELKVAPTFHADSQGWGSRRSISNYVYNHVGTLAACHEAICKALFMGGITRRFPQLNFAFLEGGVGWAQELFGGLLGHWEKRNPRALERLDPARLNVERLMQYIGDYGDARVRAKQDEVRAVLSRKGKRPAVLDEFAAARIDSPEAFLDLFVAPFYFGCEADDATNAIAFDTKIEPLGARLKAMFGSDMGHWDVWQLDGVVAEAYELVEEGKITPADFKDFVFANPVSLHTRVNPDYFEGTRVEAEVATLLGKGTR